VKLPRGPVVRPGVRTVSQSIREFRSRPGVILGDEHRFEELERGEFFKDPVHMNRSGSTRYGQMLADDLNRMLGAI
jgi:hypothetical protein